MKAVKIIIVCILISIMAYCSYNLIAYYVNSGKNKQAYEDVRDIAFSGETSSESDPESGADNASGSKDKKGGGINFDALLKTNPDCIGWIRVSGTNIDYPVVQGTDNDYYLHHDFKKRSAICGTIFADSRCNMGGADHLILYGHQMKDGSMFKELNKYKDEGFYKNHKNFVFYAGEDRHVYEIAAVYIISVSKNAAYYDYIGADKRSGFISYLDTMSPLKIYETGVQINESDSLISLSTCEYSNDDGRLIVLAKRIS